MFNTTKIIIATVAALGIFLVFTGTAHAGVIRKPPINLGLVGYWSFDVGKGGLTAHDQSGNGNTGTLTNMDAGSDWVDGQLGQALDFDGSNDYVDAGDINAIDGVSQFTFSAWVKFDTLADYDGIVAKSAVGASTDRTYMSLGGSAVGDNTSASVAVGNGSNSYSYTSTGLITTGSWQHWVGVFDGTQTGDANRLKFYFNGVQQTLTYVLSVPATTASTAYTLKIGLEQGTRNADGSIDEVRIYNRALSAAEVGRLYRMRKPKMLTPNNNGLVGYWSFNDAGGGYATDFSGNGNTGTLTSMDTTTDWVPGKLGTALDFDGSNDYVNLGNILNSITLPITFSTWVKLSSLPAVQGNIIDIDKNGNTTHSGAVLGVVSDGTLSMSFGDNTSCSAAGRRTKGSAATASTGSWHHIVGIIRGATDMSIYIDNVDAGGTYSGSGGSMVMTSNTASIGAVGNCPNTGLFFPGSIDEVRIYNRALSAAEVAGLYQQSGYAKINAPQNDQLTNGLVGYWTFNGKDLTSTTATDVSGNSYNGTLNGPVGPDVGKVGQAVKFAGEENYISASEAVFDGLSALTISAWIYPETSKGVSVKSPGGYIITDHRACSTWESVLLQIDGFDGFIVNSSNSSNTRKKLSYATSTLNVWTHVVAVWDGSNMFVYKNGELNAGPTAAAITLWDSTSATVIGGVPQQTANCWGAGVGSVGGEVTGKIDELRVYNRALSANEITRLYRMGK